MGNSKHIYNRGRFEWSLADCACEHCLYYRGKKRLCPLEVCCCEKERRKAFIREYCAVGDALEPEEDDERCRA